MTDIDINQLLKDMQRNVDYAYDKGFEAGKQEATKEKDKEFLEFLKSINDNIINVNWDTRVNIPMKQEKGCREFNSYPLKMYIETKIKELKNSIQKGEKK